MENTDIYESIGKRTGGDIYLGVVGPVRAGKSTFIKRFMDLMVIPNIDNVYERERILDEMPQSGTGRTVTTTEPKFVPSEAARIRLSGGFDMKVRLVDCVGYLIPGALGHMEEGTSRMVATPWSEEKIPFEEAAEIGTDKVIKEHSTVGIAVTCDGTIDTMDRSDYADAEDKVINQLLELNKPFAVVINTADPKGEAADEAQRRISEKYRVPVIKMDCARASEEQFEELLKALLGRFPVKEVSFDIPGYMEGLENSHWLRSRLIESIRYWGSGFATMDELTKAAELLADGETVEKAAVENLDMSTGQVKIRLDMEPGLYYRIITELMEEQVKDDYQFFRLLKEFSQAKKAYDKIKDAMEQVEARGYGIVEPRLHEMVMDDPEVFKQGNKYGVKIRAKAPTLHIIETDISTEVSPVVGTEKQAEDLVVSLKEDMNSSPNGIWDTNIFGKSLYEMVAEQMENKIAAVPDNIREKMQKSLQKISDEGREYFICIVL